MSHNIILLKMKRIITILIVICLSSKISLSADEGKIEGTVKTFKDYVKISCMPSRYDFIENNRPLTELKSESSTILALHDGKFVKTNDSIREIYGRAKHIKDKGITSN